MKNLTFVLVVLLAISAPAFAAEFLANGTFEAAGDAYVSGTPTAGNAANIVNAITGWTAFEARSQTSDPNMGKSSTVVNGTVYDGGTASTMTAITGKSCYLAARGANTAGGYIGLYQTVTLAAGSYTLTGSISTLKLGAQDGWYAAQFGIFAGAWNPATGIRPYSVNGNIPQIPLEPANGDTAALWWWSQKNTHTNNVVQYLSSGLMNLAAGDYTVFLEVGTDCDPAAADKRRFKMMADDLSLSGTPVPEPGSMLAMLAGLVGLVGLRRKR